MALDSTYKGSAADSYCSTVAEIRSIAAILAVFPGLGLPSTALAAVTAMADASLEALARIAADRIDQAAYIGVKATDSQARALPRAWTPVPRYNDPGTYPEAIKQAQVAEIMTLATARSEAEAMQAQGVSSFTIAEQSVSFGGASGVPGGARQFSDAARTILRGAGLIYTSGSVPIMRG